MSGLRLVTVSFPKDSAGKDGKSGRNPELSHTQSSTVILSQKQDLKGRLSEVEKERAQHLHVSRSAGRITKQTHGANIDFAESVYDALLVNEYAFDPSWVEGRTHHIMTFRARSKEVRLILATLNSFGIGLHFGRIDLCELTASIPAVKHAKNIDKEGKLKWCSCLTKCLGNRSYSSSDRMTLQEIHGIVDGQTHLTCEYLTLVLVAALIASVGLRRNSATTVISSMLVSPLMGPILGVTFGFAIGDRKMIFTSIRNELIGIFICLLVGFLVASIEIWAFNTQAVSEIDRMMTLGTSNTNLEMLGRSKPDDITWGVFVAIPSGVGVALAISSGGINALVGVAISAALLPPICNAGMLFAYATYPNLPEDWYKGLYSFGLFFMNLVIICLIGYITFKVKGVNPPENRKDFWREQIGELSRRPLRQDYKEDSNSQASHASFNVAKSPTHGMHEMRTSKNSNSWVSRGGRGF